MKLSDWAKANGISYITAYRWFKNDKLPDGVKAHQTNSGTILINENGEQMFKNTNTNNTFKITTANDSTYVDPYYYPFKDYVDPYYYQFKDYLTPFKLIKHYTSHPYETNNKPNKQVIGPIAYDNEYKIVVSVTGFEDTEIKVSLNKNVITVTGEHTKQSNEPYFTEHTSSFSTSITLYEDSDFDNISAISKNGLLTITIPKKETQEEEVKMINVKRE